MPNCYSRLADLKAEVQGSGAGTAYDTVLLRVLERASRGVDEALNGRHFYSRLATLLLPEAEWSRDKRLLWIGFDVASITSLKVDLDGDGVYEITLVAGTDYWAVPYTRLANEPIVALELNPRGEQLTRWPWDAHSVQLVGKIGYSEETAVATTLGAIISSTTATTFTSAASPDLSPGDTVLVDDEQMDVSVVSGTTITVTRGINGTTAATHSNGATVYRRRFPREIEQATVMQAARFYRETQSGYSGAIGNSDVGGYSFATMYPAIRDILVPYRKERSRVA